MNSGSAHIAASSHGSPQCSFFFHNGTYDGVIVADGGSSFIGSNAGSGGCCVLGVVVNIISFGANCVCSCSSIPSSMSSSVTVSTTGIPSPYIHNGAVVALAVVDKSSS